MPPEPTTPIPVPPILVLPTRKRKHVKATIVKLFTDRSRADVQVDGIEAALTCTGLATYPRQQVGANIKVTVEYEGDQPTKAIFKELIR